MHSVDLCLCSLIILGDDWPAVSDAGVVPDVLVKDGRKAFECIVSHLESYGKVPDVETVSAMCGISLPPLSEVPEPIGYYLDRIRERARLNLATAHAKDAIAAAEKAEADRVFDSAEMMLSKAAEQNLVGERVDDWTQGTDERKEEYLALKALPDGMSGHPTPWPILNEVTQGINPGEIWILVARPGTGKTFVSLHMANFVWRSGAKPFFVSMEMMKIPIKRRKDAIYARVPYNLLRKGQLGESMEARYFEILDDIKAKPDRPFPIVTRKRIKTTSDLGRDIALIRPDVVFIDGLYKMRPSRQDRFRDRKEQIAALIDELQELAQDRSVAIVATTQFNREQTKGKGGKGGDMTAGLEHLAFADDIGMNADVILGLMANDEMRSGGQILCRMLKNRENQTVAFRMGFDLQTMDFEEKGVYTDDDDKGD